ncbi:MAG TPA: hypothetical protein VEB22_12380 [Phycisphaerales bacterium]|nr:hypothetical protein [Phycisphaerales bacterium]
MSAKSVLLLPILLVAAALAAGLVRGERAAGARALLGFELKETKEELKLQYDVKVQDNGGGRMSVTFTLADEGRITPLTAVKVAVPSADKSGYFDVVLHLAPYEKDGKKIYMLHLTRDLTERGELNLVTSTMDGKRMLDWGYHRVPLGALAKAAKGPEQPGGQKDGGAAPTTQPPASR